MKMKATFAAVAMLTGGAVFANAEMLCTTAGPASDDGVLPEFCTPWKSGDAGQECVVNLGYTFGLKIDNWDADTSGSHTGACDGQGSCTLDPEMDNTIEISNNDGKTFTWGAGKFPIGAVVVKGGPDANVYSYDPASFGDGGLFAPTNPKSEKPYEISHTSFCWDPYDGQQCYEDETAWAVGSPYNANGGGNWAMYVEYFGEEVTYGLRAGGGNGIGIDIGTVTLSPMETDKVLIRVALEGATFYYDLNDPYKDENIKVQDYDSPPSGNPKVGKFAHKGNVPAGAVEAAIMVPMNNFYGIHLDVAVETECPIDPSTY